MIDLQGRDMFDRAQGSIIGAAYGDALGWPNERIHRTRSEEMNTNGSLSELKNGRDVREDGTTLIIK